MIADKLLSFYHNNPLYSAAQNKKSVFTHPTRPIRVPVFNQTNNYPSFYLRFPSQTVISQQPFDKLRVTNT